MRRVLHESPLLLERILETVEQIVYDARQADELITAAHRKTLVQIRRADRRRARRHRRNWCETALGEVSAGRGRENEQRDGDREHLRILASTSSMSASE